MAAKQQAARALYRNGHDLVVAESEEHALALVLGETGEHPELVEDFQRVPDRERICILGADGTGPTCSARVWAQKNPPGILCTYGEG